MAALDSGRGLAASAGGVSGGRMARRAGSPARGDCTVSFEEIPVFPLALLALVSWAVSRVLKGLATPPLSRDKSRPVGVGGWLLFLIFSLMFLGPLASIIEVWANFVTAEEQSPALKSLAVWGRFQTATWVSTVVICCLFFYAGYGLLRRRHYSVVRRTMIILWLLGPVASLHMFVIVPLLSFGKIAAAPGSTGLAAVEGVFADSIIAAIWTLYLSRSRRVKATYGEAPGASV